MDIDNVIYADVTYSDTSRGYKFRISAYSWRLPMTITLFEAFMFRLNIRYYFSRLIKVIYVIPNNNPLYRGKRITDRIFGATTVSKVKLAARILIGRFPILTSWVKWWKNPLRSCLGFEPYSNICFDLFHLLPANLFENNGSLYRKLTGGKI